jgi:NAD(P)-dependent dehydrogenase (short-subunit alcohol dehydrogenase family)
MSDELRFDGRVAIVTGAATGIGAAHAQLLCGRGAAVVVNDIDAEKAHQVVAALRTAGGRAEACVASVATEEGAAEIVAAAIDHFGHLDVVINNAGLLRTAPVADFSTADWNDILAVSLTGPFLVTRAAWTPMAERGYGRVLMTTSNSGLLGIPGSAAYASAKAGLWGLLRVLAIEGESVGIHVNGLAPMAYTAMSARSAIAPKAWRDGTGDAWSRRLDVHLVAPVAAWLCHDACPLTGEVLSAAGGRVARYFMGLTSGFDSGALTMEDVRDQLEVVLDTSDYEILRAAFEEGRHLHRRLMA